MTEPIESRRTGTVTVGDSTIRFGAPGRAWDEKNHLLFAAQLPDRPLLYGEWQPRWSDNEHDFEVEVMDFGRIDPSSAGSPLPRHRQTFDPAERLKMENLIRSLFASADARGSTPPFSMRRARYLGGVHFLPGWIMATP